MNVPSMNTSERSIQRWKRRRAHADLKGYHNRGLAHASYVETAVINIYHLLLAVEALG
jgi:hypothetical protein